MYRHISLCTEFVYIYVQTQVQNYCTSTKVDSTMYTEKTDQSKHSNKCQYIGTNPPTPITSPHSNNNKLRKSKITNNNNNDNGNNINNNNRNIKLNDQQHSQQ